MVMADQTADYFPVQQQSPDVADEEEVPAETAVPIKNDGGNAHRDRRQQFADTAGGYHYQERAARPLRRGSFAIPSTADEIHHAQGRWEKDSWQLRALHFLNLNQVQKIMVLLLLLDVLILFIELALDAWAPSCRLIVRDAVSCCPPDHGDEAISSRHRFLGGGGAHHDVCTSPLEATDHEAGCDEHKHHGVHVVHDVLFWMTIVILSTFEIELLLLTYLVGPAKFFRQIYYVIDLFIVTCSMLLELLFHVMSKELMEVLPGMLVLFRVWRFVRIGHGLVASTHEIEEQKTHLALEHIELLEGRLGRYEAELPERPEKLRKKDHGEEFH